MNVRFVSPAPNPRSIFVRIAKANLYPAQKELKNSLFDQKTPIFRSNSPKMQRFSQIIQNRNRFLVVCAAGVKFFLQTNSPKIYYLTALLGLAKYRNTRYKLATAQTHCGIAK